ncbi:hypothetical protein IM660_08625 [Ruania alkalisoli]|uniref:DUF6318 domain-containing protein n=1 Tax=Ruania alkalisoli TaxID=2779775 RepID=A0A7M1SXG1_9MICO|nr:DUF6318 family protein [Ruania alkalisoli]QOR72276.1 hypothetical protein IM660_08625 [Ruania alkalisoli]
MEPTDERPEVDPPERPVAMGEESVEGAIAAAEYFIELQEYVFATGSLEQWEQLSDDGCGFCVNVSEQIESHFADGGHIEGGEVEVYSRDGGGPYENGTYIAELGVRIASSEFVASDGTSMSYPGDDEPEFVFSMLWRDDAWIVLGAVAGQEPE